MHRRVGQDDLLFLVTAVSVQSQTGGNLAEVLARLATLMRQRSTLQLKVKALSAEGRLSAWFLTAMPFILYGAIRLLSKNYFGELAASPLLVPALVYGWASLIVSNIIIYRMVNFKI
jgi:tight adherence protein B